jgi:hypothetical protein
MVQRHFIIFLPVLFSLGGCAKESGSGSAQSLATEAYQIGPAEKADCKAISPSGETVKVTGSATYHARQIFDNGGDNAGLGPAPGISFPIRFAEIQVLGTDGSIFQCAQTDANGQFSLTLPKANTSYKIVIYSRTPANDTHAHVSVLNRPSLNQLYSLQTTVAGNIDRNIGNLDASVTGDVLGGAFNILDQIVRANLFLQSIAAHCSQSFSDCQDFTVAPKVSVYWMKGFDPGAYFGDATPLSFYLPHAGRLFILGGSNGDSDSSDTDHFDNSVIIHEYGHFLEDKVFATSSPGGPHNGDGIVDPRLAWSEGWGDFFQAAVLGVAKYQDTYGNIDGNTGFFYDADLETPHIGNDYPSAMGEGNFREFSVARFLWDTIDNTPNETRFGFVDNVHDRFIEVWAALNRDQHGFRDPNYGFLNIGSLHLSQEYAAANDRLRSGSDFTQIRGVELQKGDTTDYGQYVTTGTCAAWSLTPVAIAGDDGSFETSDLFRNNKFYYLKVDAPLSGTLNLDYQDADGTGTEADLDLFLYDESARFGNPEDIVGFSGHNPDGNPATPEIESIALNNLQPGKYLINVLVHTTDVIGGAVNYQLKLNGSNLCPAPL